MTDKHTPGPWKLAYYGSEQPHLQGSMTINCPSGMVCEMNLSPIKAELTANPNEPLSDFAQRMFDEQVANALLIAASPQMADYIKSRAMAGDTEAQHLLGELGATKETT